MSDTCKPFQKYYPDDVAQCFGCGYLNPAGHHIESRWEGDEAVCTFTPRPEHMAMPGYVYGGLIASLIDCHGTGTAAAASYRAEDRALDSDPPLRFVTASLHVDYLAPTPLGPPLELRAVAEEIKGRKGVVACTLSAEGKLCARGRVVAVRMPATMLSRSQGPIDAQAP